MTFSAAELLEKDKNAFENAINKYRFIKSEEYAMEFENIIADLKSFFLNAFNIHIECDIDFLYTNISEPSVIATELYENMVDDVKNILKRFIDERIENYKRDTTAKEFIEYATFEGLEFDENGNWVEGDDDNDDESYKYW